MTRSLGWALLTVLLAACADGPARPADTLALASCCGERVMSPAMDVGQKFLVFSPLVATDELGDPEPRLARSWKIDDDHRRFTFHLDPRFRWHDGTPVTSADVQFTLELMQHPDVRMLPAGRIRAVEAPDDTTVVITHTRPVDLIQLWSWYVIFPRHRLQALEPAGFYEWDFWTRPVGSGPYRYVRHDPQVMMLLEADPGYPLAELAIPRIRLKFSESAAVTDLLAGEVDVVRGVDHEQALRLAADARFRTYHAFHGYIARALLYDHGSPLFADARVRRALTLAVDRRAMVETLSLPDETPLFDGIYTYRQIRRGDLPRPLPHDPDSARALLRVAGWSDTDGDGVLDAGGSPFRFDALVAGDDLRGAAVLLQSELARVGVDMGVRIVERNVARDRWAARDAVAILDRVGNAPGGLERRYGSRNRIGYERPEVAALVARAAAEPVPQVRDSLYRQVSAHLRADVPLLWLWPNVERTVAHRRVVGLRDGKTSPIQSIHDLRIEGGR